MDKQVPGTQRMYHPWFHVRICVALHVHITAHLGLILVVYRTIAVSIIAEEAIVLTEIWTRLLIHYCHARA